MIENGGVEVALFANNQKIMDQSCGFFELTLDLIVESKSMSQTQIYIELTNLYQIKFENSYSNFEHVYNIIVNDSRPKIKIYDILSLKREESLEIKIDQVDPISISSSPIENYRFDKAGGILTLELTSNWTECFHKAKFDILGYKEISDSELMLQKFRLNVVIINSELNRTKTQLPAYFARSSYKIEYENVQTQLGKNSFKFANRIVFDVKSNLFEPEFGKQIVESWSTSGITLKLDDKLNSELFVLDELHGLLRPNEILFSKYRFFFNLTRRFQIEACTEINCDVISIELSFRSLPLISQSEYLKEFYTGLSFNDSLKLRAFGDYQHRYSLYKSRNDLLTIDYANGLVSTFDNRNFEIIFNATYPIKFRQPLNSETFVTDFYAPNELVLIDFNYEPKKSGLSFGYYMTTLNRFLSRFECELWSSTWTDSAEVLLNSNCDLFVRPVNHLENNANSSTILNVKARVYDKLNVIKSKFLNIKLNVSANGQQQTSSSEFIPFYRCLADATSSSLVRIAESSDFKADFQHIIKFNKLSYLIYEGNKFNLTYEGYLSLKFSFRYLKNRLDDEPNLIFYTVLIVNGNFYFLSAETFDNKLEVRQNFTTKPNSRLIIEHTLERNIWYYIQIQIVERVIQFFEKNSLYL